ncbi:hypothetical protein Plhal703r1_c55g0160551 [Plasmopara halstedii]
MRLAFFFIMASTTSLLVNSVAISTAGAGKVMTKNKDSSTRKGQIEYTEKLLRGAGSPQREEERSTNNVKFPSSLTNEIAKLQVSSSKATNPVVQPGIVAPSKAVPNKANRHVFNILLEGIDFKRQKP